MMGSPRADAARLTVDDIATVVGEVPGIEDWDPQAMLTGTTIRRAGATTTARVLGSSERWPRVWERGVSSGESFDAADVSRLARVAIIGRTVARALFGDEDPVGEDIQVGAVPVRVVGVLESFGTDLHGMDRDNEIVMPLTTVMRRLNNLDAISGAKLLLREPSRADVIASEVTAVLRRRHGLGRDQPDDFHVLTALRAQQIVADASRVLTLYLPLAAGIVLMVGGIVSAALMLGSVTERVSEIGLRRAVGARPEDIHRQFLIETAVTTFAGGVGGVAVGYVAVQLVASRLQVDGSLSWTAVVLSLGGAALTGWAAGVVPARRAARLRPVDALR
jgi:putative ABC transport system permease protein